MTKDTSLVWSFRAMPDNPLVSGMYTAPGKDLEFAITAWHNGRSDLHWRKHKNATFLCLLFRGPETHLTLSDAMDRAEELNAEKGEST